MNSLLDDLSPTFSAESAMTRASEAHPSSMVSSTPSETVTPVEVFGLSGPSQGELFHRSLFTHTPPLLLCFSQRYPTSRC
jgi:hypothetical protein